MMKDQQKLSSVKMANEHFLVNKVINHALEIIHLLIGENCDIVIKSNEHNQKIRELISTRGKDGQSSITLHPTLKQNVKKTLEVIQKMIGLLIGEVPLRCQDVSVYFSMEEWEYLEGHKDLYKDMMEDQPPLTSPDGSSNRNPPERCSSSLDSQESTQEDLTIPHHDMNTDGVNKRYLEGHKHLMMVDQPLPTTSAEGHRVRNASEGHLICLSACDITNGDIAEFSLEVNQITPHKLHPLKTSMAPFNPEEPSDQSSIATLDVLCCSHTADSSTDPYNPKEPSSSHDGAYTEESSLSGLECTDRHCVRNASEGHLISLPACDITNSDIAEFSPHKLHPLRTSNPEESSYQSCTATSDVLRFSQTADSSTDPSNPKEPSSSHDGVHTEESSLSSLECSKSFKRKSERLMHTRSHNRVTFPLSQCGKTFNEQSKLLKPQNTHKGGKRFSCNECGKHFNKKENLIVHQRVHTGERPYSCSQCGKCFIQKGSLHKHQKIHTGERPYSCSECSKCFTQKKYLLQHLRVHTGERPHLCSECGKRFTQKRCLLEHQRVHTGERPYSCSQCGKGFIQKRSLQKHQQIHAEERPFSCSQCGKCFSQKGTLHIHQKIHTGERPYSCSECGKCFTQKRYLLEHQRIHTGECPYLCSQCGQCFSRKGSLKIHQKIHAGVRPFSCSECGKSYTQKRKLLEHQKIHTGERPYSCLECGKCFIWNRDLLKHTRIHTNERPYSCSECGKGFILKRHLFEHQKIHTGERPYSCSECEKGFILKASLIRHQRIHTGVRPYSCSQCGKCFSQKETLQKHQRLHTGERPYSCSECGKRFAQKVSLIRHQINHAGELPS